MKRVYAYEDDSEGRKKARTYAHSVTQAAPPTYYFGTPMKKRTRTVVEEEDAPAQAQTGKERYNWKRRAIATNPVVVYGTVPRTRGVYGQGEMKYYDSTASTVLQEITTTWSGTECDPTNGIATPVQGAGINERIGREIKVHKIKIKGLIIVGESIAADIARVYARILLVWDKQTNAAQMQGEDLLDDGTSNAFTLHSFQALKNFGRFQVLKDKFYTIQNAPIQPFEASTSTGVYYGGAIPFKITWNFTQPVAVRFNATGGGGIASVVDNSFHIIGAKLESSLSMTLQYRCRVCYKE